MSIWLDLILFILAALLAYAFVIFARARLEDEAEGDEEDWLREEDSAIGRLYPRRLIRQAGLLPRSFGWLYWVSKILLAILIPMGIHELFGSRVGWLLLIAAGILGFLLTDLWLLATRRTRRARIKSALGYFVDLLAAFLESGMSLPQAFRHAARYGLPPSNPLTQEAALIGRELEAGADRVTAFRSLADRTGVDDLRRLAAVMSVGVDVGAPVKDTLAAQAELLRERQWQEAMEILNKKALAALFPLMLVSFPMFFVLVFFPSAVQLNEALQIFRNAF